MRSVDRSSESLFLVPNDLIVTRFFGRGKILDDLTAELTGSVKKDNQAIVVVLYAMGGQGKTQIALQ